MSYMDETQMNHRTTDAHLLGPERPRTVTRHGPLEDLRFFVACQRIAELQDDAERARLGRRDRRGSRLAALRLAFTARTRTPSRSIQARPSTAGSRAP